MKILVCICLVFYALFAKWSMFSDGKDTYIYNDTTGDIYIRYKKGGKNYEDIFIKMPSGVIPKSNNLDVDDINKLHKKEYNRYNDEGNSLDNSLKEDLLNKLHNIQNDTLNVLE